MPELPDVEVFTRNLHKELAGSKLLAIKVIEEKKLPDKPAALTRALKGKVLKKVYRSGKEMRFQFDDTLLGLHLMLTGDTWLTEGKNEKRSTIVEMHFDNGKNMVLTDRMKNAKIQLNPVDKDSPDVLSKHFTLSYFCKALERKKQIKSLLTDQDILRGIGNSYSDEILWASRISPYSIASAIPAARIKELYTNIKKILRKGITNINKHYPGIVHGEVKAFLQIHTLKKEKSPTGAKIIVDKKAMMKTYYTKEQRLYQ